jgi:hypothetical protein
MDYNSAVRKENGLVIQYLIFVKDTVHPERLTTNRFECPYNYEKEKRSDTKFDVNDLYDLASIAFAVEIALAVARKDTSAIQIKNKQDIYHVLNAKTGGRRKGRGQKSYSCL